MSRVFYTWLALHSLLIGLLPFYLPVFLWQRGYGLFELCAFIAVSGVAFVASLRPWRRIAAGHSLAVVLAIGFAAECLLVLAAVASGAALAALVPLAILNGLYNACFWTTQRVLFLGLLGANDSGRQFGNFQLFVTVFLKLGILTGGWLLERDGLPVLTGVSVGLALAAGSACLASPVLRDIRLPVHRVPPAAACPLDRRTRLVFLLDGPFLFLEAHFWTLSLFLLTGEDFARLGGVVVLLAVLFSLLFLLVKNRIDSLAVAVIYRLSVGAYVVSWLLRAALDTDTAVDLMLALLVVITFCTTLFRLAFNKRFFDLARHGDEGIEYLIEKSRLSQWSIALTFVLLAGAVWATAGPSGTVSVEPWLRGSYLAAAVLALGYLGYRPSGIGAS